MAIKFTPEYKKEISKVVRNYNQKVRRANTEAKIPKSQLPKTVSLAAIKKNYTSRADLNRELETLKRFSRKQVKQAGEDKNTKYDLTIIKTNREAAIKHYEKLADVLREKTKGGYPLKKARLRNIENNLDILKKMPSEMDSADIKIASEFINDYRQGFIKRGAGYRGFLSEVDAVMDRLDIPEEDKKAFFEKFEVLDQEEFYELYEKNDLINKIYDLADSPKLRGGRLILNDDEKKARRLINTLMRDVDLMIKDVKSK